FLACQERQAAAAAEGRRLPIQHARVLAEDGCGLRPHGMEVRRLALRWKRRAHAGQSGQPRLLGCAVSPGQSPRCIGEADMSAANREARALLARTLAELRRAGVKHTEATLTRGREDFLRVAA